MNPQRRLSRNLLSEARAYGYTLSIWGGGGLLLSQFGTPSTAEVFAYVGGAIVAFGLLALLTFGDVTAEPDMEKKMTATSFVHVFATIGNLLVSYLLTFVLHGLLAFLVVGVQTTFTYNVLLLPEEYIAHLWHRSL
ncbi:hypothetical protein [Haladaptatus sp.]|uniref:hypothetical protein n=1 Tax=Haladaptatus sp. TaxID=1973141 RepID=UPI003C6894F8